MRFTAPEERKAYPSRCDLCGGDVVEAIVTLTYPDAESRVRVIEGAPAGVCDQCHEKYLSAEKPSSGSVLPNMGPDLQFQSAEVSKATSAEESQSA